MTHFRDCVHKIWKAEKELFDCCQACLISIIALSGNLELALSGCEAGRYGQRSSAGDALSQS